MMFTARQTVVNLAQGLAFVVPPALLLLPRAGAADMVKGGRACRRARPDTAARPTMSLGRKE